MLVSQSMITPMSADAEWRQSLRIRPQRSGWKITHVHRKSRGIWI